MLVNVKSNEDLDREQSDQLEALRMAEAETSSNAANTPLLDSLTALVLTKWEKAKTAKRPIQIQMLKNLRQREGEYEPEKLAAIKSMGGSEMFIKLSDTKCRSGKAWVKDVLFQPGMKPWDVEPTPIPELPPDMVAQITQDYVSTAVNDVVNQALMSGMPMDFNMIQQQVMGNPEAMQEAIDKAIKQKAKDNARKVRDKLDDQLIEGGWYMALNKMVDDVIDQKAGFLKGPIFRMKKVRKMITNPETGRRTVTYEEKPIPTYERRSPFDIYPSPDAVGINDGYLFDRISMTRKDLLSLRTLPGYKVEAIDAILERTRDGATFDWLNLEHITEQLEAQGQDTSNKWAGEKIDCLEFWGTVNGKTLIEYGMDATMIPDPTMDYDICCWIIDRYVIKCMLNYNPMGEKPFFKVSFVEKEDNFWGSCVPELIDDIQAAANAVARAIVNNVGVASGPQIEMNIDRVPPGTSDAIWPLRVWKTTEVGLSTAPALKVYNIPMNADKLIQVYNHLSRLADDHCGIPAYAHGDSQVGGAGNTASGLSMLMTQAARGIKDVIRSIDLYVIAPSIEYLFFWNLDNNQLDEMICDMNIEAKGTSSLIAKEQQAVRLTEFLTTTNNPTDLQILGIDGRKDLLVQAAKANEINVRGLEEQPTPQVAQPGTIGALGGGTGAMPPATPPGGPPGAPPGQTPGAPPAGPRTLDAAGNPAQGEDTRLIGQDQAPQMRARQ